MKSRTLTYFLLSILLSGLTQVCIAQDSEDDAKLKQREAGLAFYDLGDLGDIGLIYRFGHNKALWRISAFSSNGSDETFDNGVTNPEDRNYFSIGATMGREWRWNITDHFQFRAGADMRFFYSSSSSSREGEDPDQNDYSKEESTDMLYRPGINFIGGFNYVINNKFVLGAELSPSIIYTFYSYERTVQRGDFEEESIERTQEGIVYNLWSDRVLISFLYRF